MKHVLIWMLLAAIIMTGMSLSLASAETESPKIYVSWVPECGEDAKIEGAVHGGADFAPSEYRLALGLQLQEGRETYFKPYANRPYESIASDGVFTYQFNTGGSDITAQVLTLYLIPAAYVESFSGNFSAFDPSSVAVDTVVIRRTGDTIRVTPERTDDGAHKLRTTLPVSSRKIGVNVGFYTNGQWPDSELPAGHIASVLDAVAPFANTVRFYRASGAISSAYAAAAERGLHVAGMAYLDSNAENNRQEMDALIALCKNGCVDLAIVGNETLLSRKLTEEELLSCISYVREGIRGTGIPVATSDSVDYLIDSPRVRYAVDVLMPNIYPYWGGCKSAEEGMEGFTASMNRLIDRSAGKQIVVSETMWPTENGSDLGNTAAAYFEKVRSWSVRHKIPVLFFEAADEPWKANEEGACGAHWGILDASLTIKPCYREVAFFRAIYPTDGVLVIPEETVTIEDYAFANCTSITEVHIPASVQTIADTAFDGCGDILIVSDEDSAAHAFALSHDLRWQED